MQAAFLHLLAHEVTGCFQEFGGAYLVRYLDPAELRGAPGGNQVGSDLAGPVR